jgi:hypothetical protein
MIGLGSARGEVATVSRGKPQYIAEAAVAEKLPSQVELNGLKRTQRLKLIAPIGESRPQRSEGLR